MKFQNVSPEGDLEVVGVGQVPAGGEFTATGDLAESLLDQPRNFKRTDKPEHHKSGDKPSGKEK